MNEISGMKVYNLDFGSICIAFSIFAIVIGTVYIAVKVLRK